MILSKAKNLIPQADAQSILVCQSGSSQPHIEIYTAPRIINDGSCLLSWSSSSMINCTVTGGGQTVSNAVSGATYVGGAQYKVSCTDSSGRKTEVSEWCINNPNTREF